MKIIKNKILALSLLACLALATAVVLTPLDVLADMAAGMTGLSGLDLLPSSSSQTNSLVVRDSSGTAKLTVTTAGAVTIGGTITGPNGESIDNTNDDFWEFQGGSGTDDTDLRIDLDGTRPGIESPTDTSILIDENLECTGDLTVTGNDITFGNAETISNATNGIVAVTSPATTVSGSLEVEGGNLILQSGDLVTNAVADTVIVSCAGACADATDLSIDVDGTSPRIFSTTDTLVTIDEATLINAACEVNGDVVLESGDIIDNSGADVISFQCDGACADDSDISFDVDGTYPVIFSTTDTTVGFNDLIAGQSGDTISNATPDNWIMTCAGACTNIVDLTVDVDAAAPAGPVVLSSTSSTSIEVAETLDVSAAGGLVLSNDETVTNAVDGTVLVTAPILACSGALDVQAGTITLDNGELIDNTNADDFIRFTGVGGTNNVSLDLDLDAGGAGGAVQISSATSTQVDILEILGFTNGETIDNATTDDMILMSGVGGTNDVSINFDLDAAAPAGPVVISSASSTYIEVAEGLDVTDALGITLSNDATITNAVDGTVLVTEPAFAASGSIEAQGGDVILQSGDVIDNAAADTISLVCAGACANGTDLAVDLDAAAPAGPVILSSAVSSTIEVAEALDVSAGTITQQNDEVIDNSVDDTVTLTGTGGTNNVSLSIDLDAGGAGGAVQISSSTSTQIDILETIGGASSETLDNFSDDFWTLTGVAGTNNVALSIDLDATGAGGAVELSSSTSTQISILEELGLASGDKITNAAADTVKVECGGACADATDLSIGVDGTHPTIFSTTDALVEIDDPVLLDGAVEANGTLTLESGDQLINSGADVIELQCAGACADATDIEFALDGTRPIIRSGTDTEVEISDALIASGGMTLTCTDCITATNLADNTRDIAIPLLSWRVTSAGNPLPLTSASTPNTDTEGSFEVVTWATGENTQKIETTIRVPANYVSGMTLIVTTMNDNMDVSPDDLLSVTWYAAKTGEPDNPAANDECAAGCAMGSEMANLGDTSIALDAVAISPGDTLRVIVGFFAIDETINIASIGFTYTASM